jgi:hypothetical protein
VLNATYKGAPETTGKYVPRYPAALPFHDPPTFEVGLVPFGEAALEVFLAIENPTAPKVTPPAASEEAWTPRVLELAREYGYTTIGEFYGAIVEGLEALDAGGKLFRGDPSRQIPPHFYFGSGGKLIAVKDLGTAKEALRQIVEQGEGEVNKEDMFDPEGELAHFYRFQELQLGKRYEKEDHPFHPTGPPIEVDFKAVFPMKPNLRAAELTGELKAKADSFNALYSVLLREIQKAIDGQPEMMKTATVTMFKLHERAEELLKIPLPDGSGLNAGPTFEFS